MFVMYTAAGANQIEQALFKDGGPSVNTKAADRCSQKVSVSKMVLCVRRVKHRALIIRHATLSHPLSYDPAAFLHLKYTWRTHETKSTALFC